MAQYDYLFDLGRLVQQIEPATARGEINSSHGQQIRNVYMRLRGEEESEITPRIAELLIQNITESANRLYPQGSISKSMLLDALSLIGKILAQRDQR